jgi:aerobic-type carbon monoxide dehydrogenase small subunit (CoxS/CutS family)
MRLSLRVNGAEREIDVPARTTLLSALRDDIGLTGTRYGCGVGQCGACFVLADGRAVPSCVMTVEQAVGMSITTVEGLAKGDALTPLQQAFIERDAMQCGYCTSGMLISATALLARDPHPSDASIRDALSANLCRCGVYVRAVDAVKQAAGTPSAKQAAGTAA